MRRKLSPESAARMFVAPPVEVSPPEPEPAPPSAAPSRVPFDKKQWLAARRAKVDSAAELLKTGVAALQTSEEWEALLRTMATSARAKLSPFRYSFGNQLLLALQRDRVSSVATYKTWQRHGRCVRRGESGMMILAPRPWKKTVKTSKGEEKEKGGVFFGTTFVFDVSQTDGEPLPEPVRLALPIDDDETFAHTFDALRDAALAIDGQPVVAIDLRARMADDNPDAGGWYIPSRKTITVITTGRSHADQFRTGVHEVAHALLHPAGEHHAAPEREVEAESVSYVVCAVLGLDTARYAFPYVAAWAKGTAAAEMVTRSGERIVKAAHVILDAVCPAEPDAQADDGAAA